MTSYWSGLSRGAKRCMVAVLVIALVASIVCVVISSWGLLVGYLTALVVLSWTLFHKNHPKWFLWLIEQSANTGERDKAWLEKQKKNEGE